LSLDRHSVYRRHHQHGLVFAWPEDCHCDCRSSLHEVARVKYQEPIPSIMFQARPAAHWLGTRWHRVHLMPPPWPGGYFLLCYRNLPGRPNTFNSGVGFQRAIRTGFLHQPVKIYMVNAYRS
jgi:hypothetical protein